MEEEGKEGGREGERGEMCRRNGFRGGGVRCVRAIEINTRRQAEMCVEREIKRRRGEEGEREKERERAQQKRV